MREVSCRLRANIYSSRCQCVECDEPGSDPHQTSHLERPLQVSNCEFLRLVAFLSCFLDSSLVTSPWRDVASQRAARAPALPTRNSTSTLTSMLTSPCAFDRSASHRALAASPSTPARTTCDSVLTSSRMSPLQRHAGSSLAHAWSTERRLRVAQRFSSSTRSSARTTSAQLQTTTRATCVCCVTSTRTCSRFGATASRVFLQHVHWFGSINYLCNPS